MHSISSTDRTVPADKPKVDLFERARHHERAEQIAAAKAADLLPYFRQLEGPAGPVVQMEGA